MQRLTAKRTVHNVSLSLSRRCISFSSSTSQTATAAPVDEFLVIGDVRGRGLMLGVELVSDRNLKTPAIAETLHIMDQMKELGVLVGKGGYFGNVFRITPPLCFTKDDADYLVEAMDYSMSRM
ncbi:hypothetical protein DY000_02035569 [Brassica cretica]|uniref:Uncharacterized protein n=1 Tax=Brassica cretica TaxID=69181 RepID=A0ABQ7DSE5_BRACR|nr:hypothetical protein DY000_02035569 [Brassica cretica]